MKRINRGEIEIYNTQAITELKAVLKPPVVEVIGDNNTGKTTFLNNLSQLLGAKMKLNVTEGQKEGGSEMTLTTDTEEVFLVSIERSKDNPDVIKLVTPDNKTSTDARAIKNLKELFGFTHMPLEKFLSLTENPEGKRKINNMLLEGLPEKTQEQYQANLAIYSNSTKAEFKDNAYNKRKAKNAIIDAAAKLVSKGALTKKEIDLIATEGKWTSLVDEKKNELRINNENNERFERKEESLKELNAEKVRLQKLMDKVDADIKEVESLKLIDNSELEESITNGEQYVIDYNNAVARKASLKQNNETISTERKVVDELNKQINDAKDANVKIIQEADFGIDNLEIHDDGLTIEGIPFSLEHMAKSDLRRYGAQIMKSADKAPFMIVDDADGINAKKKKEIVEEAIAGGYIVVFATFIEGSELKVCNEITIKEA